MCQWKELRKQFRLAQFRLQHPNAADFAQSPWFGVLVVFLYRFAVAAFCTGWTIRSGFYSPSNREKWFIYLTNWSFFFVNLYFICATIATGIHYKKVCNHGNHGNHSDNQLMEVVSNQEQEKREESRDDAHHMEMRWYHEALWVIYNIAAVAALLVTISFWSLIYPLLGGKGADALSVIFHGINSLLIVGETLLCSIPVRLFHAIYPMLYSVAYVVFTVIYWACGGTSINGKRWIYPQTDYSGQPVFAVVSLLLLCFIGLPLCQGAFFGLYVLRGWIEKKCGKKTTIRVEGENQI